MNSAIADRPKTLPYRQKPAGCVRRTRSKTSLLNIETTLFRLTSQLTNRPNSCYSSPSGGKAVRGREDPEKNYFRPLAV